MAARVWPFQSDEGIPINCDWCAALRCAGRAAAPAPPVAPAAACLPCRQVAPASAGRAALAPA
jgi:hypothetical protein